MDFSGQKRYNEIHTSTTDPEARLYRKRRTLGADKAYDVKLFIDLPRICNTTPHIATKKAGYTALDGRTTRHVSYLVSQRKRKRVEEIFGWLKTVGMMRKTRHRGMARVRWMFTLATAACSLVRIRNLQAAAS